MSLHKNSSLPTVLAEISRGRDHIQTDEFARAVNRKSQTIRKNFCQTGHYMNLRPIKFGNKLLWKVEQIAALLNGEVV